MDDHVLVGESVAALVRQRYPGVQAHAVDAMDPVGLEQLLAAPPNLCLVDLVWGDGDYHGALDLISALVAAGVTTVVFGGLGWTQMYGHCIELGAVGVISKHQPADHVCDQIRQALTGCSINTDHDRLRWVMDAHEARTLQRTGNEPFGRLSLRESEVLGALVNGLAADEIAAAFFVSVVTVRSQIRAIFRKLGVRSQLAAVAKARRAGWNPPECSPALPDVALSDASLVPARGLLNSFAIPDY